MITERRSRAPQASGQLGDSRLSGLKDYPTKPYLFRLEGPIFSSISSLATP